MTGKSQMSSTGNGLLLEHPCPSLSPVTAELDFTQCSFPGTTTAPAVLCHCREGSARWQLTSLLQFHGTAHAEGLVTDLPWLGMVLGQVCLSLSREEQQGDCYFCIPKVVPTCPLLASPQMFLSCSCSCIPWDCPHVSFAWQATNIPCPAPVSQEIVPTCPQHASPQMSPVLFLLPYPGDDPHVSLAWQPTNISCPAPPG